MFSVHILDFVLFIIFKYYFPVFLRVVFALHCLYGNRCSLHLGPNVRNWKKSSLVSCWDCHIENLLQCIVPRDIKFLAILSHSEKNPHSLRLSKPFSPQIISKKRVEPLTIPVKLWMTLHLVEWESTLYTRSILLRVQLSSSNTLLASYFLRNSIFFAFL